MGLYIPDSDEWYEILERLNQLEAKFEEPEEELEDDKGEEESENPDEI